MNFCRILLVIFVLFSAEVFCEGRVEGEIDFLQAGSGWTDSGVYVLVKMQDEVAGKPGCATDQRFAIDPSTEIGKAIYSILLAAKHAQSEVFIVGDNSCDLMGNTFEGINYVRSI
jgi:hypothetical protein